MSEQEKSNAELVRELIEAFTQLKEKFDNPNRISLEQSIQQLIKNQDEMKGNRTFKPSHWCYCRN